MVYVAFTARRSTAPAIGVPSCPSVPSGLNCRVSTSALLPCRPSSLFSRCDPAAPKRAKVKLAAGWQKRVVHVHSDVEAQASLMCRRGVKHKEVKRCGSSLLDFSYVPGLTVLSRIRKHLIPLNTALSQLQLSHRIYFRNNWF